MSLAIRVNTIGTLYITYALVAKYVIIGRLEYIVKDSEKHGLLQCLKSFCTPKRTYLSMKNICIEEMTSSQRFPRFLNAHILEEIFSISTMRCNLAIATHGEEMY